MKDTKLILIVAIFALVTSGCTPLPREGDSDINQSDRGASAPAKVEQKMSTPKPSHTRPMPAKEKKKLNKPQEEVVHHDSPWGYEGRKGPDNWGELKTEYHLCSKGKRQSPIDIAETEYANLGKISINYKSGPANIVNNGHTIQVNMHKGSRISVNGKKYRLLQFHFHAPSEHMIKGKPADMVAHFVHQASDGELTVIAVLMEGCLDNRTMKKLWRVLPAKPGRKHKLSRKINVEKLIPNNRAYYNYSGSLTTPPCTEGVNWIVMKNMVTVSKGQIRTFTELFPKSVRLVQENNYRIIKTRN